MPGTPVARLVSAGGQQVRMSVPEAEIGQINVGDKGRIDVATLGGKSYRATVTEKGVTANALSRSYDVRLKVDNADSRLLPGMVVSVTLSSRGATGYPVVPAGIVQIDERNKNVCMGGKRRQGCPARHQLRRIRGRRGDGDVGAESRRARHRRGKPEGVQRHKG